MLTIAQLLGKIPTDERYEKGEWVTGTSDEDLLSPELAGKTFQVIAVDDILCTCESTLAPYPPGAVHEPWCRLSGKSRQDVTIEIHGEPCQVVDAYLTHTLPPNDS